MKDDNMIYFPMLFKHSVKHQLAHNNFPSLTHTDLPSLHHLADRMLLQHPPVWVYMTTQFSSLFAKLGSFGAQAT